MKILVATDLSEFADEAIRQGHAYVSSAGDELALCHVLPNLQPVDPLFPQRKEQAALEQAELMRRVSAGLEQRLAEVTGNKAVNFTIFLEEGTAYAEIMRRAEAWGAELVVVASRGATGLKRVLLGSVAEQVVRYAHCPVLVARPGLASGGVVAATDLSDPSLPAIEAGVREACRRGAKLTVVHVLDTTMGRLTTMAAGTPAPLEAAASAAGIGAATDAELRAAVRARVGEAIARFGGAGEPLVPEGLPGTTIVDTADQIGAELIVVGTRGRTGIARMTLGSVAEKVVRHAHCSVLVVRLHGE